MRDAPTKVFTVMCALVIVWVGVYWFYDAGDPPVTFGGRAGGDPAIQPDPMAVLSPGATGPSAAGKEGSRDSAPSKPATPASARPPTKPAVTEPPAATRVIPPKFHEYVVQPGDTSLQVIARKLLGDAKHWQAIASANKYVDPRKLIPGRTRLLIPDDPRNVEGLVVPVPAPTKPEATPAIAPTAEQPASPQTGPGHGTPEFTEYVIQRQDTLSDIAKAMYGKSSLWRLIYDANRDVIPDPDHLKLGTTIRIPKNPG